MYSRLVPQLRARGRRRASTIIAYCLWAFEKSPTVGNPVWFQLSIVPFVLGILRYALLLEQGGGGAPEEVVLADRVLRCWARSGCDSSPSASMPAEPATTRAASC